MFIDSVDIKFRAGNGGNGIVSWRREARIAKGGPFGGDGGRWGDLLVIADPNINTLSDFRYVKEVAAEDGERWGIQLMHGANAPDKIVKLPVWTLIYEKESGKLLHDLAKPGEVVRLCIGGKGGYGNAHFVSSTRRAPHFCEHGDLGTKLDVHLELKLVADVGIIGMPSAGKSTLISCLTSVRPKIADYPFTTLIPNLGVMEYKGKTMVLEDVPGLIPGAHKGEWLGIQFLKHIERTRVLCHLLDGSKYEECIADYDSIRQELGLFNPSLLEKEEIIVVSKIDILDTDMTADLVKQIKKKTGKKVFPISAPIGEGLQDLQDELIQHVILEETQLPKIDERVIIDLRNASDPNDFTLVSEGNFHYRVIGERIEQIVRMTPMRYPEAVDRVWDVMHKRKIIPAIEKAVRKEIESIPENMRVNSGNLWYTIPGKVLIGEAVFKFSDYR